MRSPILMVLVGVGLLVGAAAQAATAPAPRWLRTPVCPLVSGLPRQEGDFILGRVSEIARDAGAPLAAENCTANLYILVSREPKALLEGMQKRNRKYTFGPDASPSAVDDFIATARPVRVWYDTNLETAYGLPPGDGYPDSVVDFDVISKSDSSHILANVVYSFSRIFVVVDANRLQGVSRGQLADYVGVVGLLQLRHDARFIEEASILKLFDQDPHSAPAGLTDWDRNALKSLYATDATR